MGPPSTLEGSAPRLTVSILTRDSANRIAERIAEALTLADEVIVGVDAASTDATFAIASELAHATYRFSHEGQLAPARLLPFEFATGDWILSLDDDESIEKSFDALRPELLRAEAVTHYYFPRKWIVNLDPCEYLRTPPWFPDWQLRLFLNDAALVWKPPWAHSGYRVQGLGHHEARAGLLHFEPLWCGAEERRSKIEHYRQAGGGEEVDAFYQSAKPADPASYARCTLREAAPPSRLAAARRIHPEVRALQAAPFPDWRASLSATDIPRFARAGSSVIAEIFAQNTGRAAWSVPSNTWPKLNLAFHLLDSHGQLLVYDGPRFPMPRTARAGDTVRFLAAFAAPSEPGAYLLEWDLVSDGECWFRDCGSEVLRTPLRVS